MNKIFDYTNLTFNELIEKISISRFFHLPKMVAEALRKIPSGGGSEPAYKVYTALINQSGTDDPVATVLENTLGGDVVWSYVGIGEYIGTSSGLFTIDKTFITVINRDDTSLNFFSVPNLNEVYLENIGRLTNIYTDEMAEIPIEIRVYS